MNVQSNGKVVRYYECSICQSLNHPTALHCHYCGTIPAHYSWTGKPIKSESEGFSGIETVVAKGCDRASQHHAQRIQFKTVSLDYYAEV